MADHTYSYRNLRGRSRWAMGICAASIVLFVLSGAVFFYDWLVLGEVLQVGGRPELINSIRAAGRLAQTTANLSVGFSLLTYLLFFVWLYRASANAQAMGAELSYGAGLSVGMFFIPGLNLFLPPMMMSELVRASVNAPSWRSQPKSPIVPLWWTLQIIATLGGFALNFIVPRGGASVSEYRDSFLWIVAFQVLSILHFVVIALLIGKVSRRQRRQWEELNPDDAAAIFS